MIKREWTFFSNHGIVLAYVAKHPQSTTQEIAQETLLSVWGVQRIITDLAKSGYIGKHKNGRCNHYQVYQQMPLRHRLMYEHSIGDVLQAIGHNPENDQEFTEEKKE